MSPRQAWETIGGAIRTDGLEQDCAPLLTWLCHAATSAAANQPSGLIIDHPPAPVADAALFQNWWSLVERDMPALSCTASSTGAHEIATAIGGLAQEQRDAQQLETN